jgi:transcriptional regulator with XRE-family HTH domain
MSSSQERLAFSQRLQQALHNADHSPTSPTRLAREFNHHFNGHPVTAHAARKWLQGESIPTQEKLRALASWLDVPADWLRFGSLEQRRESGAAASPIDAKLRSQLHQLDEHQRALVYEFARMLVRFSKKK